MKKDMEKDYRTTYTNNSIWSIALIMTLIFVLASTVFIIVDWHIFKKEFDKEMSEFYAEVGITTTVENTTDVDEPEDNIIIPEETTIEVKEQKTRNVPEEVTTADVVNNPTTVSSKNIITDEYVDLDTLKQVLSIIAPNLIGIEDSVLYIYETTEINPFFQIAKFCLESGYGTSNLTKNKNNIAGWNAYPTNGKTSYENATVFESLDECVLTVGNSIYNNYVQNGYTTVDSISKKYCPPNSQSWANSVKSIMSRLMNTYNSLI